MKLFPTFWKNYAENHYDILGSFPGITGLRFGTQLHGGFARCSLSVPGAFNESFKRYRKLMSSHLVIFDSWYRRAYEGRVQDITLNQGNIDATVEGYYLHGDEVLHGAYYPGGVGSETYTHNIVKDAIALTDDVLGERTWAQKFYRIFESNFDIGEKDFTEAKIVEAIEEAAKYGYRTDNLKPVYFALYGNRVARFFPEPDLSQINIYSIDWFLTKHNMDLGANFSLSQSRGSISNKVWYLWDDDSSDGVGPTLSASPNEDWLSQKLYGTREGIVNIGGVPEAVADMVRDIYIERNAFPRASFKATVKGYAKKVTGQTHPVYMIRAGDIINITDLGMEEGTAKDLVGQFASGLLGFVIRTEYDYDSNSLSLEVGTEDKTLDTILARWGVSGGLS